MVPVGGALRPPTGNHPRDKTEKAHIMTNASTIVSINPNVSPKLDSRGKVEKTKYTVVGKLTQGGAIRTGEKDGRAYAYGSIRRPSGEFLDLSFNATVLARVQAQFAEGTVKATDELSFFGEYFTNKSGKPVLQVLAVKSAAVARAERAARKDRPADDPADAVDEVA